MFIKLKAPQVEHYQTKPLRGGDISRIARVVAGLRAHFIESHHWSETLNKGSYTLKNHFGSPKHIILFVDSDGAFAARNRIPLDDAFVVGVDLSTLEPLAQDAVRERLCKEFRFYVDPREQNNSLWQFLPANDSKPVYDVLFLEKGPCPYEVDEDVVHQLSLEIEENFVTAQDGKAVVINPFKPVKYPKKPESKPHVPRSITVTRNFGTWAMSRNYSATVHDDGRVEISGFLGQTETLPQCVTKETLQRLFKMIEASDLLELVSQDFENPSRLLDAGSVQLRVTVGRRGKKWHSGVADYWGGKEQVFNPIIELFETALAEARR